MSDFNHDPELVAESHGIESQSIGHTCPTLHFGVGTEGEEVLIVTCHAISFAYLTPERALRLAHYIEQAANRVLEQQMAAASIQ